MLPAAGQNHLYCRQADRVVGGFGGFVIGVGDDAVNIVFDGLGDPAQGVEGLPGLDPLGIGDLPSQTSGVVGGGDHQHGVGTARDARRAGVAGTPVGADIDGVGQAVSAIVVAGGIADAGFHPR